MSATKTLAVFNNEFESENEATKGNIKQYYYGKVKSILNERGFNDSTLETIAEGVVERGEKLVENAVVEEKGSKYLARVNDISYKCSTMHSLCVLYLSVDDKDRSVDKKRIAKILPNPGSRYYVYDEEGKNFQKGIQECDEFLQMCSGCFSSCIVFLGKYDSEYEELTFKEKDQSVPVDMIEKKVIELIERIDEILPKNVFLVFPIADQEDSLFICKIHKKVDDTIEATRFVLNKK